MAACDRTLILLLLVLLICLSPLSLQLDDPTHHLLLVSPLMQDGTETSESMTQVDADSITWAVENAQYDSHGSLTFRIMHRDSPYSPLKHLHDSPQELLIERLKRDAARVAALSARAKLASHGLNTNDLEVDKSVSYRAKQEAIAGHGTTYGGFTGPLTSGFKEGSGEYFIRLGVGTPAKPTFMVVDTGSDVMWLQCTPCLDCYKQIDPIFNPSSSSSFRKLSCKSPICALLELHACGSGNNQCMYQVAYGDGSFTSGEFAVESLSFGGLSTVRVAMGCGHDNEGLFAGAAGLFGLGGGTLSFPSQLGRRRRIFSYCLMDRDREGYSTLVFGGSVPKGTVYTQLLRNPSLATFYYVGLSGISVGGSVVTIPAAAFKMDEAGGGGVIIDSGTSVTRLVEVAYGPLRSAFRQATKDLPFSGGFSLFDTCYDLSRRVAVKVPTITLHFEGGADMALPTSNVFVPVDSQGTYCLAFASTAGGLSIIGNIQQQGFRVVVDGVSSRVGFAPNQC